MSLKITIATPKYLDFISNETNFQNPTICWVQETHLKYKDTDNKEFKSNRKGEEYRMSKMLQGIIQLIIYFKYTQVGA